MSHSNQLLVLRDSSLIWAASMAYTPVQLATASFQSVYFLSPPSPPITSIYLSYREQNGIIVSVDEQGHLACSYLGTDPTMFTVPHSSSRDASFEVSYDCHSCLTESVSALTQPMHFGPL